MNAHSVEQPTIAELRDLLDDARGGKPGTCWTERVLALNEAFGMRRTWPEPADKEFRIEILRYLHDAGL